MKKLIIVSGKIDSGKTRMLEEIVRALKKKKIAVGGFLSVAEYKKNKKVAYHLKNIKTGREIPLATKKAFDTNQKIGNFYFNEEAFIKANEWLSDTRAFDVVIIDEIGPLEMRGGGFCELLDGLFLDFKGILIVCVRDSILDEFRIKFPHPDTVVLSAGMDLMDIISQ